VLLTRPLPGEDEVSPETTIQATFNMPMNPETFTGDRVIVSGGSGDRGGTIGYDPLTHTVSFTPDEPFQRGETISVLLADGLSSLWNETMEADYGWSFQITTGTDVTVTDPNGLPDRFALQQNYPNPFNAQTTIRFSIGRSGAVMLGVYNILGQLVETLYQGKLPAGQHQISWNGTDRFGRPLASGVYFCRLEEGGQGEVRRMVLVR
jgi:hypothetical protein